MMKILSKIERKFYKHLLRKLVEHNVPSVTKTPDQENLAQEANEQEAIVKGYARADERTDIG